MANLLEETLDELSFNNLSPADVEWVGLADGSEAVSWDAFAVMADIEYMDGCRGLQIAADLVVMGKTWWLKRVYHNDLDYTTSEWWEFCRKPKKGRKAGLLGSVLMDAVKERGP